MIDLPIEEIVRKITAAFHPRRIVMFGSTMTLACRSADACALRPAPTRPAMSQLSCPSTVRKNSLIALSPDSSQTRWLGNQDS